MYELMIVSTVGGASGLFGRVEKFLKEAGASNVKTEKMGKKTLAYPIKKQNEAEYFLFYFESEPSSIVDLVDKLKFEQEDLLRHLLLVKKESEIRPPAKAESNPKVQEEETPAKKVVVKPKVTVKTKVVKAPKKAASAKATKAKGKK